MHNASKQLFVLIASVLVNSVTRSVAKIPGDFTSNIDNPVKNYFHDCMQKTHKLSCIAERASTAVEDAIDMDIQLVPGLVLARNDLSVESSGREGRSVLERFGNALKKFADTHTLNVELGDEARRRRRRRLGLLLSALLGAFGITNAMILKTLAIISGKALLASKMALMIIGIVGLKKMFSKNDGNEPAIVQVHTLHDEHDRNVNSAMYNIRHI
ncbi:Osiris 21 [Carabus blaptoides fortunei]